MLVLALVMAGGEPQASLARIGETLLACTIVLVVGHLPTLGRRGDAIRARLAEASGGRRVPRPCAGESEDREARWALRREAYRTLAEARAAIALASAELPPLARHADGADEIAKTLERLVDTTTAAPSTSTTQAPSPPPTSTASPPWPQSCTSRSRNTAAPQPAPSAERAPKGRGELRAQPSRTRTRPARGAGNCARNPHEPAPAPQGRGELRAQPPRTRTRPVRGAGNCARNPHEPAPTP